MTGPTAATPSPHDVPDHFVYHPTYDEALIYIAETDDVSKLYHASGSGTSDPSSSSSLSSSLDWPVLKNAIKVKISKILADFPENPTPLLHSAAMGKSSLDYSSRSVNQDGLDTEMANGGTSSSTATTTPEGAASALASRFSTSIGGDDDSSDDSDLLEDAILASASAERTNGQNAEADDSTTAGVISTFMAARTRPPPELHGSWGRRLSKEETQRERLMVFAMLDEFDSSPPFTIQRLCELLLSPTTYVRSGPKFLSSLTRILAMTASHADFPPVSPGLPPNMVNVNGSGAMDHTSGMVGPPSPNNEPIFSPIPFLRKVQGDRALAGQDAMEYGEEGRVHTEGSVPPFSLNDGDADDMDKKSAQAVETFNNKDESDAHVSSQKLQQPAIPAPQVLFAASEPTDTSPANGSAATTTSLHVPLGVPVGRVDELDQVTASPSSSKNGRSQEEEEEEARKMAIPTGLATEVDSLPVLPGNDETSLPGGGAGGGGGVGDFKVVHHSMDDSGTVHPLSSTTTLPNSNPNPIPTSHPHPSSSSSRSESESDENDTRANKRLKSEEIQE